jgi:hypothetical protein
MSNRTQTFSDSDWTREPPLRARIPPAQRRMLILTTAIALLSLTLALAVFGIEQWLDASAREAVLEGIGTTVSSPAPAADAAPVVMATQAAASVAAPLPAATVGAAASAPSAASAASAAIVSSPPAAVDDSAVKAQQLAALEAEMRQRARENAAQEAIEAERRKERAWQRFYQRPEFCADNPTAAQMVLCANDHIRARRAFEERYATGKR